MTDNTTKVDELTNIGDASVGDALVGEHITGQTVRLNYAPKVEMDTAPKLSGNLNLNGHNLNSTTPTKLSYLNNVTSDIQAQLNAIQPNPWFNVKSYGAVGDGVTDDTAALQALLTTVGSSAIGGVIYFPSGTYLISSALAFPATGVGAVKIMGDGIGNTVIKRKSTFTSGDLLYITTSITLSPLNYLSISDITFQNTAATVSAGASINITARPYVAMTQVEILDGYDGILISGNSTNIWVNKCLVMQTQLVAMNSGLTCSGGHQTNIILSDSLFSGQSAYLDASMMTYGVYIGCSDGCQINNCFMSAKQGIRIDGGGGQSTLDVYVTNCIIDSCSVLGVNITGNASSPHLFTDIHILNCHISPLYATGFVTVGVQLTGNCDHISIVGNTIGGCGGPGIILNQPSTSYLTIAPRSIKVHDNDVYNVDLDASSSGSAAIQVAANQHGVHLVGNFSGNMIDTGNIAPAGISLAGPNNNIVMVGNNFKNSATPVGYGLTVNNTNYPNLTVYGNCGADDYMNTIKAGVWNATAITVPYGGTGVTSIPAYALVAGGTTSTGNTQALATGSAGQFLRSGGSAALPAWSTATIPATAGTSGKLLISDGTNFVSSTPTYPNAAGTSGKLLQSNGTNFIVSTVGYPSVSASGGKMLISNGTDFVATTPAYPNTGANRKMIVGDGTNYVESTETWAVPGTTGNLLVSDGTNWTATKTIPTPVITGFTDASNAASGVVGETLFASVTSSSQTSTTVTNNTSLAIPAGDWMIWGGMYIATGTAVTLCIGNIYTTSASIPVPSNAATQCFSLAPGSGTQGTLTLPIANIKLSGTTTYYLNTAITFTGAITSFWGFIAARRVR